MLVKESVSILVGMLLVACANDLALDGRAHNEGSTIAAERVVSGDRRGVDVHITVSSIGFWRH